MKRSRRIQLVLLGSLSTGALTGCTPSSTRAPVSASQVYTNNFYLPGAGYYHAPYRGWFQLPYNHYDASSKTYYHGGQWSPQPHESITNISAPTPQAAAAAQTARTDVQRGGFGSTSRGYSTWS